MSITRIEFADNQAMDSNLYELPINPVDVMLLDEDLITQLKSVDENPIFQKPKYDPRIRKLIWRRFRTSGSDDIHATFATMVAALRVYVGSDKFIDMNDIAVAGSKLASGPHKINVVKIVSSIAPGGGIIRYNAVEMHFVILEEQ